jgi:hypothetical protein
VRLCNHTSDGTGECSGDFKEVRIFHKLRIVNEQIVKTSAERGGDGTFLLDSETLDASPLDGCRFLTIMIHGARACGHARTCEWVTCAVRAMLWP